MSSLEVIRQGFVLPLTASQGQLTALLCLVRSTPERMCTSLMPHVLSISPLPLENAAKLRQERLNEKELDEVIRLQRDFLQNSMLKVKTAEPSTAFPSLLKELSSILGVDIHEASGLFIVLLQPDWHHRLTSLSSRSDVQEFRKQLIHSQKYEQLQATIGWLLVKSLNAE